MRTPDITASRTAWSRGSSALRLLAVLLAVVAVVLPARGAGGAASPGTAAPVAAAGDYGPGTKLVVIGDSFTQCFGASSWDTCWEFVMARQLGWDLELAMGDPAGAFTNAGWFGSFYDMVDQDRNGVIPADADVVVIQGGFVDSTADPGATAFNTLRTVQLVQRRCPNARIIVLGSILPSPDIAVQFPGFFPNRQAIWSALFANPVSGPAGGALGRAGWVDGTLISYQVSSDRVHPTDAGHVQIGQQAATLVARVVTQ